MLQTIKFIQVFFSLTFDAKNIQSTKTCMKLEQHKIFRYSVTKTHLMTVISSITIISQDIWCVLAL